MVRAVPTPSPVIRGDERAIKQALLNLLANAVKFTPIGGNVHVNVYRNAKGGIVGRQVQLVIEDSTSDKTDVAVQKARKLIQSDKVDFLIGNVNSSHAIAIAQVAAELKVLHIVPGGHADAVTGTSCHWTTFRICNTGAMQGNAMAGPLINKIGKKYYVIAQDYAFGHSLQEGFDPDYAADSVGYVLRSQVLKQLIADGVRRYDFLGGADESKMRWGAELKNYLNLHFARPFSRGSVYLALKNKGTEMKDWLRSRLPAGVWKGLKGAVGKKH